MIKKWPGWANYLFLWVVYTIFGFVLYFSFSLLSGVHLKGTERLFVVFFIFITTAVHCGMYLAKWRYYEDGSLKFW